MQCSIFWGLVATLFWKYQFPKSIFFWFTPPKNLLIASYFFHLHMRWKMDHKFTNTKTFSWIEWFFGMYFTIIFFPDVTILFLYEALQCEKMSLRENSVSCSNNQLLAIGCSVVIIICWGQFLCFVRIQLEILVSNTSNNNG